MLFRSQLSGFDEAIGEIAFTSNVRRLVKGLGIIHLEVHGVEVVDEKEDDVRLRFRSQGGESGEGESDQEQRSIHGEVELFAGAFQRRVSFFFTKCLKGGGDFFKRSQP